ncbi:hypothetical protein G5C60_07000 [Streptomyces sp. HC44]|uniref:Uncharacterized protein n=1 Tax=Streptomyces scabichelini TaxID=2711217 RepID=A0A6G4V087_9ACTN|nr:hypothetical protein [Streptomyces scabichelini]NGO07406.1 hypothetical protein [Streptomyces scabichelini]
MNEKRAEEPGTETKVPRDLPPSQEEAEREDAIVDVPAAAEEEPSEAYPDTDEAGSGRRDGAENGGPQVPPVEEEPGPQEQPD